MHARLLATLAVAAAAALAADAPRPVSAKICTTCHTTAPGNLRGYLDNVVVKTGSFQLKMDDATEVLRYDKAGLKVVSEEKADSPEAALKAIKKGHEIRVEFTEKDGVKTATLVSVKPPVKLAAADMVSTEEVQRLVALGAEKGKYFLFDSRPPVRFNEGTIPTAVNLPFPAFDKNVGKLPADKNALVIFFCNGKTCNMSPSSLAKARKLGYTNAKVYVDGMPAWYAKHHGVVSPASFKEAFLDKDIPAVILDVRPAAEAAKGFIKGAVSVAPGAVKDLLAGDFPATKLKPPVLVVDAEGGETARAAALEVVKAGYPGVNVLTGGFKAWQAAGLPAETGAPATQVAYVPKLRPGSVSVAEFTRVASLAPEARKDVVILDVRSREEAKAGMIKGALNVPQDELDAHLGEIPKDKRLLIHCGTGARAEMAFNILKDRGYNVAYLNSEITIIDSGEFTID